MIKLAKHHCEIADSLFNIFSAELARTLEQRSPLYSKLLEGAKVLGDAYEDGVKFLITTPPFVTLREQTIERLYKAGLNSTNVMLTYGRLDGSNQVISLSSLCLPGERVPDWLVTDDTLHKCHLPADRHVHCPDILLTADTHAEETHHTWKPCCTYQNIP